ncbi:MAG: OmpH family outer membrane protein [Thermodesulfobacteriota bacterium]|nr:OmpH family outer membrane protein [Thermodesulfobacteriota bacterium]
MKQVFGFLVAIVLVFCFQLHAFGADVCKFGVVDMQELQEKSISFQETRELLKERFGALQKKLDDEKDELLRIEEEFKKQSMMLSLDAKEDKWKKLEKKKRHYKYVYDEAAQEMKEAELDARKKVAKEIGEVVKEIGQREGFTMIFEKRMVGLIFSSDAIDITGKVIKAYDMEKK